MAKGVSRRAGATLLQSSVLELVRSPSRRMGERFPMAVDLAQNHVAAGLTIAIMCSIRST